MKLLWREVNDAANEYDVDNYRVTSNKTTTSGSFEYKTKVTRKTSTILNRLDIEIVVSLKIVFGDLLVYL